MSTRSQQNSDPDTATGMPKIWLLGMRPRTLTMAAVPIIVGSALAWSGGAVPDWATFAVTLFCAVLIQVDGR